MIFESVHCCFLNVNSRSLGSAVELTAQRSMPWLKNFLGGCENWAPLRFWGLGRVTLMVVNLMGFLRSGVESWLGFWKEVLWRMAGFWVMELLLVVRVIVRALLMGLKVMMRMVVMGF
uniref:Uncharacterized protein MANES_18G027000 n=1 Tax=Rhizophora mucronata TaxID=61149 RepID=A0A2P2KUE8_RHIMU